MSDDYPIPPGSPLDRALTLVSRYIAQNHPFDFASFKLIDLTNPNHMLALGTRVWLTRANAGNVDQLVSNIRDQWYGQGHQ